MRSPMDSYLIILVVMCLFVRSATPNTAEPLQTRRNHRSRSNTGSKESQISDLRVRVVMTIRGTLEADVTWTQKLSAVSVDYLITWGRHSCNVDIRMPNCPLLEKTMPPATLPAKPGNNMRILLVGLTFNSEYHVTVSVGDVVKAARFYTDLCEEVDSTFMRCGTASSSSPENQSDKTLIYNFEEGNTDHSAEIRFILVLASTLSVGAIFILVVLFYLYRRCVELDQAKFNNIHNQGVSSSPPTYSELPLLDVPICGHRQNVMHDLKIHRPLAQAILSGATPFSPTIV